MNRAAEEAHGLTLQSLKPLARRGANDVYGFRWNKITLENYSSTVGGKKEALRRGGVRRETDTKIHNRVG
jgi:hypothetical protein